MPLLLIILWIKLSNEKHIWDQTDYLKTYLRTKMTSKKHICGPNCNFDIFRDERDIELHF
jgi:hypothetical protein